MSIAAMRRGLLDWRGRLRRALAARWAAILVSLIIAAPLFAIAAPRLVAEVLLVPARITLEELRQGAPASDATLNEAAQSLARGLRFAPGNGRLHTDRAWVILLQAERAGIASANGRALLEQARQELESGLSRDPANGFGWARLAMEQLAVAGKVTPAIRAALDMSYATTPFEPNLMRSRAELAFTYYDELDPMLRARAGQDIAFLWSRDWTDQKAIINHACRNNRAFVIAEALRKDKDKRAEFDRLYKAYMSPEGCASKPF